MGLSNVIKIIQVSSRELKKHTNHCSISCFILGDHEKGKNLAVLRNVHIFEKIGNLLQRPTVGQTQVPISLILWLWICNLTSLSLSANEWNKIRTIWGRISKMLRTMPGVVNLFTDITGGKKWFIKLFWGVRAMNPSRLLLLWMI